MGKTAAQKARRQAASSAGQKRAVGPAVAPGTQAAPSLLSRPVPDITTLDMAFGNIKHLPAYSAIPDEFKRGHNPYARFVSGWFFSGRTPSDMARLTAREGVDRAKALAAVKAILGSWEPQHEHKEAGCAYLLFEWFDLAPGERG